MIVVLSLRMKVKRSRTLDRQLKCNRGIDSSLHDHEELHNARSFMRRYCDWRRFIPKGKKKKMYLWNCAWKRWGMSTDGGRNMFFFFLLWRCDPTRVMTSSFLMFLNHTQRRITVGRTPLDEWPARRRDLYLTTHNTHNRQTSMPPVGFELTISAGDCPQTYILDRAATGTGYV